MLANRSKNQRGRSASAARRNLSHQAIHVKNFMQSIDPSRKQNRRIPSSPQDDDFFSTASKAPSRLPFLPPQESFGMEPPLQTPPSLPRRSKTTKQTPSSSISSVLSTPSPSLGLFYSSNRTRIQTKIVPYPRRTLFWSPDRAMVSNDSNANGSLLQEISNNTYGVPQQQQQQQQQDLIKTPTKIGKGSNSNDNNNQWIHKPRYNPHEGDLFEADPPVIGRRSSPLFFDSPVTPTTFLATPKKQQQQGSIPLSAAIVTDPWYTPTLGSPPKRVSLDTGTEDSSIPAPMLRPNPSAGTAMAASALLSLMEEQQQQHVQCKRSLNFAASCISDSPTKKYKMIPHRIVNPEDFSTPIASKKQDEENRKSVSSNRSEPSPVVQKPKEKVPVVNREAECKNSSKLVISKIPAKPQDQAPTTKPKEKVPVVNREVERKNSSKLAVSKIPAKPQDQALATKSSSVSPSLSASGVYRRIPRRFIDDPKLPVLKSGMRLAAPNDPDNVNSLHCFVRAELLEVFVVQDTRGTSCLPCHRVFPRVGLRCVHCGAKPKKEKAGTSMSAFFPKSVNDIYRGVCTWQRIHFHHCKHIPKELKVLYKKLKENDRSRGKKAHWVQSAEKMGFRNVDENRNGVVYVGSTAAPPRKPVTLDLTILETDSGNSDPLDDTIVVHV